MKNQKYYRNRRTLFLFSSISLAIGFEATRNEEEGRRKVGFWERERERGRQHVLTRGWRQDILEGSNSKMKEYKAEYES